MSDCSSCGNAPFVPRIIFSRIATSPRFAPSLRRSWRATQSPGGCWCPPRENPIGFLGFANDTIEALFIDPDHHGQGGGKLLVAQAQRLSTGALAVDVNEQNEAGLRFYEALGFTVVGRSPTDTGGRPFPLLHMKRAAPGFP